MMNSNVSFRSRRHAGILALTTAAAACGLTASLHAATAARPNVILILVDDMGWSDLGCQGSEISTPNIDALAATGVRFRQFYNGARCSPTRAALLTGLHTPQVAQDPAQALPTLRTDNNVTIAELLKSNGYRTYMAGKWHLGNGEKLPENRGFQHVWRFADGTAHSTGNWDQGNYKLISENNEIAFHDYVAAGKQFHQSNAIGDYTLDFIDHDNAKGDAPFFAYMAFGSPHFPLQVAKERADAYTTTYAKGWDVLRQERYDRQLALGIVDSRSPLTPRGGTGRHDSEPIEAIPAWDTLPADRQADLSRRMSLYAGMLTLVDENVGRVVAKLRETGQLDNTLIFFMSDNGGNLEGGKFGTWNGTTTGPALTGTALANMGQPGANDGIDYGGGWANLSNTPLRLFKHATHEGGTRTPFIVHWPTGVAAQNVWRDGPGAIIDVLPTIAAATGAVYPTTYNGHAVLPEEGVDLLPVINGGALPQRSIFVEHEGNRSVRDGKWKLVTKNFTLYDNSSIANARELYDMDLDPTESNNLADENPTLTLQLMDEFNAWAVRTHVAPDRYFTVPPDSPTPQPMTTDLFVDTFNRPDATDIDASLTGVFGSIVSSLAPGAVWFEGFEGSGLPDSIKVTDSQLDMAYGPGMAENGLNHNFIDPEILGAGGFSISLKVLDINTATDDAANRYAGFGVGLNATQAAGGADIGTTTAAKRPIRGKTGNAGTADCFVEVDLNKNVKVWVHGAIVATVPVAASTGTLTATFSTAGFTTADQVTVSVYFNGTLLDLDPASASFSKTFKWDENNQNYLALSVRGTNYVRLDNFAVRKLPLGEAFAQEYAIRNGLRDQDAAPNANVDGDALGNFGEWAFGSNPGVADDQVASTTLVFNNLATQGFRFAHRRLAGYRQLGVKYQYYISTDLEHWIETIPVEQSSTPLANSPGYEAAELKLPDADIKDRDRLFLKVSAAP
jgi:arylsulfatase